MLPKLGRKTEPSTGETILVWQENRSNEATRGPVQPAEGQEQPNPVLPAE